MIKALFKKKCHLFGPSAYIAIKVIYALLVAFLLSGCIGGGKPADMVEQYILEYASPMFKNLARIDEGFTVERFSVAQAFNTRSMIYREHPFNYNAYNYHRWRVNPGDMVTDFVLRDARNSGIFKAVFSYRDTKNTRFILEGQVGEFLEIDKKGGRNAALSLTATLLDLRQKEITKRVVFQKTYRSVEPIEKPTARGLAKGMSRAMKKVSEFLIADIHNKILNSMRLHRESSPGS